MTGTQQEFTGTDEEMIMSVLDTTALPGQPARQHSIDVGDGLTQAYNFKHNLAVTMPFDHAMKFRHVESFIVMDPEGNRYDPNPEVEEGVALQLAPDEVIARFEELTQDSLYARCKAIPGSEGIKVNSRKADLVTFLTVANEGQGGVASNGDALEGIETIGMSADEAASLIPDDD